MTGTKSTALFCQRGEFNRELLGRIAFGWGFHLVYARFEVNGHLLGRAGRQRRDQRALQAGPGDLERAILGASVGYRKGDVPGLHGTWHFHVPLAERDFNSAPDHRLPGIVYRVSDTPANPADYALSFIGDGIVGASHRRH